MIIKINYKKTKHKLKCFICKKSIIKGTIRIIFDNDNYYNREIRQAHIDCVIEKIDKFKKEIPDNEVIL